MKPRLGYQGVHVTKKTKQGVPCFIAIPPGADKAPAKTFGKREQERAAKYKEKHAL